MVSSSSDIQDPAKGSPFSEDYPLSVCIAPLSWMKKVDNRRRHQPGLPSRSHAIRELVIQALDAAEAPKSDKKPKP